jgi:hypothetical protein
MLLGVTCVIADVERGIIVVGYNLSSLRKKYPHIRSKGISYDG